MIPANMNPVKSFTGAHLGIPRLFFFVLTSILSMVTVALSSWALSVGISKQNKTAALLPGGHLDISNIIGAGGAVVAASGVASLLCLWLMVTQILPHKPETKSSVYIKEFAFGFACLFWFVTLVPSTYFLATGSGVVTAPGIPQALVNAGVAASGENLAYKSFNSIVSYVVTGWLAFLSTAINLVLVSMTARHMLKQRNSDVETPELHPSETNATHDKAQMQEKEAFATAPFQQPIV